MIIAFCLLLYGSFLGATYLEQKKNVLGSNNKHTYPLLLLYGLILRFVLAGFTKGYSTDMSCFNAWSEYAASRLPWHFYSNDFFCDYPPGYLYILTALGHIKSLFGSAVQNMILKTPAILFDLMAAVFIFRTAVIRTGNYDDSVKISSIYLFAPAVIINSSVWGQIDSILAFLLTVSLYYLSCKKYYKSALLFALAVITKPQALLIAPVFLFAFADTLKRCDQRRQVIRQFVNSILVFAAAFILSALPFIILKPFDFIIDLYKSTLGSYSYCTLNAFNIYSILGLNGEPVSNTVNIISIISIILSVISAGFIILKSDKKSKYLFASAVLLYGVFCFAAKMHERYLYPVIILLLLSAVIEKNRKMMLTSLLVSVLHFINVAVVYENSLENVFYLSNYNYIVKILSLFTVLLYFYTLYLAKSYYMGLKGIKSDKLPVLIVTLIYAAVSFINLGNTKAPQSVCPENSYAEFKAPENVSYFVWYKGVSDSGISLEFYTEDGNAESFFIEPGECFRWNKAEINLEADSVRITTGADVFEAGFVNDKNELVKLESDSTLFDEQGLISIEETYLNSTYFDEIYHARTAYEHIHFIPQYETTHPPLGKLIIGLGIRIFGMNPFGWRFMGTLAGILMLPVMYFLAFTLFKKRFLAAAATAFMAVDFMHITQTRLATIDSFPVLFIMLSYLFMCKFFMNAKSCTNKYANLTLFLSGLFFGFAISTKWIGIYSGFGLALLFFAALYRRVKEKTYKELLICLNCVLYFLVIPFIIYYAGYIPIHIADEAQNYWVNFWNYQKHMFNYHSELKASHPFSSKWFTWPIVYRPIWYYGNKSLAENGITSSIVGMGNPLVWWLGTISVFASIRNFRDDKAQFIIAGFLSQYLPWVFIPRTVFIYHYFASTPFIILALVYVLNCLNKKLLWAVLILSALLFIMFYPVLTGLPVEKSYVTTFLTWFNSWVITY